jgi:phasin family protein
LQFFVHCSIVILSAAKGLFMADHDKGPGPLGRISGTVAPNARPQRLMGYVMAPEDFQKFGKEGMDMAMSSFGVWSKSAQAIAAEIVDYSKKSVEDSAAAWEKLLGAKTPEKAMEVQSQYLKSSYEDFIAEATKLGELYVDLAKEAYRPFEGAFPKVGK